MDEWYKAAYYDPSLNSGLGGYWKYATRSNTAPGNRVGNLSNQANYNNGVYSVTQSSSYSSFQNYLTPVGAFTNSASAYGTYDQAGNVWNWIDGANISNTYRLQYGGTWGYGATNLVSTALNYNNPGSTNNDFGFRVATSTPEPSSIFLIGLGGILMASRRRMTTN